MVADSTASFLTLNEHEMTKWWPTFDSKTSVVADSSSAQLPRWPPFKRMRRAMSEKMYSRMPDGQHCQ